MTIYFIVAFLLVFVLIGIVLVPALIVAQIIFITLAAMKAQDGGFYHYPYDSLIISQFFHFPLQKEGSFQIYTALLQLIQQDSFFYFFE